MRKAYLAFGLSLALVGCGTLRAGDTPVPEGLIAPAPLRADFRALYDGLQSAHYDLYANTSRAEYDALFTRMNAGLDRPMTPLEAQVYFQRFIAVSHVAHARLDFPAAAYGAFREAGGRGFPLSTRIDDGRLFITANMSGLSDISPGDEIVTLNGQSAAEWIARVRQHVSADIDYLAAAQIDQLFAGLLWLELGEVESFVLTIRKANGATENITLPAHNRDDMRAAAETAPPGLEIDPTERVARVLPGGVAYLRPGIFLNYPSDNFYDTTAFHAFIDDAFAQFAAAGATRLLIDVRNNPGGDNSFSDHMIAYFADEPFRFTSDFRIRVSPEATASNAARLSQAPDDSISHRFAALYASAAPGDIVHFDIPLAQPRTDRRFSGQVFLLINRRSYSNSVSVAAILQDYGFATIIGEPTSDLATTYGAMEQFTLPNTGFNVGFPKAYILRPNGDARVAGVTPDVAIRTPVVQSADDPVLQEALRIVSTRGR